MFGKWLALKGGERTWMPARDVLREDGELIVRVDAPGTERKQVEIEVQEGILTTSGEHEQQAAPPRLRLDREQTAPRSLAASLSREQDTTRMI